MNTREAYMNEMVQATDKVTSAERTIREELESATYFLFVAILASVGAVLLWFTTEGDAFWRGVVFTLLVALCVGCSWGVKVSVRQARNAYKRAVKALSRLEQVGHGIEPANPF